MSARKPDGFDLMLAAHSPDENTRRAAETMLRRGRKRRAPRKPAITYTTIADVVRAKLAGTLPRSAEIVVDNDECAYSSRRRGEECCPLRLSHPVDALIEVLDVLGIKAVRP